MSSSFCDLARHFGALPPSTVASLTSIAEARGRAEVFRYQSPAGLETLRRVALIQSTEASNAIATPLLVNVRPRTPTLSVAVTTTVTDEPKAAGLALK